MSTARVERSRDSSAERQLVELARSRGPLRRVIAALAGRWVERQGWSRLGFARLSDHARERLGLSGRSVQELARVGAQLPELPGLEAALVSGRLPWSKVRLLARFVSADDEAHWIEVAAGSSVRLLEKQLRAADRGSLEAGALAHAVEGEPARHVRLRVPPELCFKWQRVRNCASKVEGGPLTPGDVLERVTAEVVSALPVAFEPPPDPPQPLPDDGPPNVCAAHESGTIPPPRIPPFLLPLLDGLDRADPFELDARLRRALRLEQRLDAQIAPLLRHVTSSEYEWREHYASVAAFARECLGMSPARACALLRVERAGDVCPELRAAYRDGSLSWVQAQALVPLLLSDTEGKWRKAWVAFASTVTVLRLTETVERARLLRDVDAGAFEAHLGNPAHFAKRDLDERQVCARPTDPGRDLRITIRAPVDVARLFEAALCTVRRAIERETGRLGTEAEAFEAMIDHAIATWDVDDLWLRRRMSKRVYAVFDRDDWRCVFPGCTSRRNLHLHHIEFRSAGGSDDPSNLTTLCAFHHLRGVHAGTVSVRGTAPDGLAFELGLRPGQPPLASYPA